MRILCSIPKPFYFLSLDPNAGLNISIFSYVNLHRSTKRRPSGASRLLHLCYCAACLLKKITTPRHRLMSPRSFACTLRARVRRPPLARYLFRGDVFAFAPNRRQENPLSQYLLLPFFSSRCSGRTSFSQSLASSVPPPPHPPHVASQSGRARRWLVGTGQSSPLRTPSAPPPSWSLWRDCSDRRWCRCPKVAPSLPASVPSPVNAAAVPGESRCAAARLPCRWFFPLDLSLPISPYDGRIPSDL